MVATSAVISDAVPSLVSTLNRHVHSASKVYPTLADGVLVTAGAGAWVLGAFSLPIVPTNGIPFVFDIHGVDFDDVSADDTYELVLYAGPDGSEVEVGRTRFHRSAAGGAHPAVDETPFQCPQLVANTQIKAKLASKSGGADSCRISIRYHTYGG